MGFRLFHVDPNSTPRLVRWNTSSSFSPSRLGEPYGILCGAESNLIVVDLGVLKRDNPDTYVGGWEALKIKLVGLNANSPLAPLRGVPVVRSPSGGIHLYFQYNASVKSSFQSLTGDAFASGLAGKTVKINVLGDGKMVTGPGCPGYTNWDFAAQPPPCNARRFSALVPRGCPPRH